jgi:hypothetical protein
MVRWIGSFSLIVDRLKRHEKFKKVSRLRIMTCAPKKETFMICKEHKSAHVKYVTCNLLSQMYDSI